MSAPDFPRRSSPAPLVGLVLEASDQPLFTRFVKGLAGHCRYGTARMLCFLTDGFENGAVTGSLLANPALIWPVSSGIFDFVGKSNDPGSGLAVCGDDDFGGRPCTGGEF